MYKYLNFDRLAVQLEQVAAQKWGSLEAAEQEKQARIASKEQRALQKAKDAEPGLVLDRSERSDDHDVSNACQYSVFETRALHRRGGSGAERW